MKQNCPPTYSNFKKSFLQKFAGKLNTISKNGDITDQKGVKLPLINSFNPKRSNTCIVTNNSLDKHTLSSEGIRPLPSPAGIRTPMPSNHFVKTKTKMITEQTNSFIKKKHKPSHLKTSSTQSIYSAMMGTCQSRILISQRNKMGQDQSRFFDRQRFSQHDEAKRDFEDIKKTTRSKRYFI